LRPCVCHMDRSATASASRLATLDGIRAVAILLVVVPHIQLTDTLPGPVLVQRLAHDFGHGVEIFFVLSGFCLALPLLTELRNSGAATLHLSTFFFNRAFRIVPLYYAAIVLCSLLALFYYTHWHKLPPTIAVPQSPWDFAKHFLLLDRGVTLVNSSFWSIPVQLRWYVLFPVLIALYVRSRRVFVLIVAALVFAYNATRIDVVDVGTLPLFMFGIMAADLMVNRHPLRHLGYPLIAIGLVLGHLTDRHLSWTMLPTTFGWQIAAFGFVLAATNDDRLAKLLSWKPLVALGAISFSVYLLHEPLVEIVAAAAKGQSGLLGLGVTIAIAAGFWLVAERHFGRSPARRKVRSLAIPALDTFFERIFTSKYLQLRDPEHAPSAAFGLGEWLRKTSLRERPSTISDSKAALAAPANGMVERFDAVGQTD
jgi:peptidoglycan/LPS O-acetylase OafA/YrhL